MANTLKLKRRKGSRAYYLEMDREFAKRSADTATEEFRRLQEARACYPDIAVEVKHIKVNPKQRRYHGLNYDYMKMYINYKIKREEATEEVMKEFENKKVIAQCFTDSYGSSTIRQWFLKQFPEIKEFGMPPVEDIKDKPEESNKENDSAKAANNSNNETVNTKAA